MRTTIDRAGRVVIPAEIRAKAGLRPGIALDILFEDNAVHIRPDVSRARLVQRHGRLVAEPTAPAKDRPPVDAVALVKEERDRWPV
jgi:AbrB family looped-hinge helix DNA binding protein